MKITQLVTNPSGFDRALDSRGRHLGAFINLNEELAEIQNDSWLMPKDISGWRIQDGASFKAPPKNVHKYVFAKKLLLPGQKIKLHTGKGEDTSSDLHWNRSAPVWNNEGDTVYLFDESGNLIDKKAVKVFTGAIATAGATACGPFCWAAAAGLAITAAVAYGLAAAAKDKADAQYEIMIDP